MAATIWTSLAWQGRVLPERSSWPICDRQCASPAGWARQQSDRPVCRRRRCGAQGANCGDWLSISIEPPPTCSDPNAAIICAINEATADLNATIEQAVAAAHATGVNIVYVDVTAEFAGAGIGSRSLSSTRPEQMPFTRMPPATVPTPMPSQPNCHARG